MPDAESLRSVIERIYDEWEFPHPVKDADGWQFLGPTASRIVYLEPDPDANSVRAVFSVNVHDTDMEVMLSRQTGYFRHDGTPIMPEAMLSRQTGYFKHDGTPLVPHFSDEELHGPLYLAIGLVATGRGKEVVTCSRNIRSQDPQTIADYLHSESGEVNAFDQILLIHDDEVVEQWVWGTHYR
jgi:hypothetical protein